MFPTGYKLKFSVNGKPVDFRYSGWHRKKSKAIEHKKEIKKDKRNPYYVRIISRKDGAGNDYFAVFIRKK